MLGSSAILKVRKAVDNDFTECVLRYFWDFLTGAAFNFRSPADVPIDIADCVINQPKYIVFKTVDI